MEEFMTYQEMQSYINDTEIEYSLTPNQIFIDLANESGQTIEEVIFEYYN